MPEPSNQTTLAQELLNRHRRGDDSAREELIESFGERLRLLARKMLHGDQVHRWAETDDVWNNALLRLHRALATEKPESVKHFFSLATTQIRRELVDLARHYFGPEGIGAHHLTDGISPGDAGQPRHDVEQTTHDPAKLFDWTLFHEKVGTLPAREQEVFDLHWYGDLKFVEIAELLGVDRKEVSRLWGSATEALRVALHGEAPGL